jgi:LysM repeat protein
MSDKKSAQNVIASYRKRQKMGPYVISGLAILLIVAGIVVVAIWLMQSKGTLLSFQKPTETPTVTITITNTAVPPTETPTLTPTDTATPTITMTPTASGPFEYIVEEGDNCTSIAEKFSVKVEVLLALNNLDGNCLIQVAQTIMIPPPDMTLPSSTPVPTDLAPGTQINYTVQGGDTLEIIAAKFYSTVDAIVKLNTLANKNDIKVGQTLKIPVFIATAVPTRTATKVPTLISQPTSTATP